MSFQPVVPLSGLSGWRFLERTEAAQRETFNKGPELARDIAYFRENIGAVETAEDLVGDRRLLKVALGAFGMSEEIDKRAFVRKILEDGTEDPSAFANRLVDRRYKEFAATLGFGNISGSRLGLSSVVDGIVDGYMSRSFEEAVGNVDQTMRLALNFRREIREIAGGPGTETARWLNVLGDRPMREVMIQALGIPNETSSLDLDKQAEIFADRAQRTFGASDPAMFGDPAKVDEAIRTYLLRAQAANGPSITTPGFTALTLLGGAGASAGITNLVLSRT
ncbi:MAG: DUF1217 domain-containing protein [Pseudomonadota bacterium]